MISNPNRKCPVCGGRTKILYRGNTEARSFFAGRGAYKIAEGGGSEKLDVYECLNCGLGFSPQDLTEKELWNFYAIQPKDEDYLSQEQGRRKTFKRILNRIEKVCRRKGKIFDFGSG